MTFDSGEHTPPGMVICPVCEHLTTNGPPLTVCDRCAERIWFMVDYTKRRISSLERNRNVAEINRALNAAGDRSVVYYIRFGDRVKIGTTRNLAKRLDGVPCDEILATEPGDVQVERQRQGQFRDLWVTGEWFRYEEPLISHIASLREAAA